MRHSFPAFNPTYIDDAFTAVDCVERSVFTILSADVIGEQPPTPEEVLLAKENHEVIAQGLLTRLTPREERATRLYYGIGCAEHTLDQIGEGYGVTRERIRQILAKAQRKLKFPYSLFYRHFAKKTYRVEGGPQLAEWTTPTVTLVVQDVVEDLWSPREPPGFWDVPSHWRHARPHVEPEPTAAEILVAKARALACADPSNDSFVKAYAAALDRLGGERRGLR